MTDLKTAPLACASLAAPTKPCDNIVAERVLGLPKETGIDSKSPFRDLAKN